MHQCTVCLRHVYIVARTIGINCQFEYLLPWWND